MTAIEKVKTFGMIAWLLSIAVFVYFLNIWEKRRAERILSHAKFYLFSTTCSYPQGRRRDSAAIDLLTAKIFEVRNE
jgi:hypothetical protein